MFRAAQVHEGRRNVVEDRPASRPGPIDESGHAGLVIVEWAPENPLSPWLVRPEADPGFTPEWICSTDPTHRWSMALATRSNGGACPDCRETGKSRVELEHFTAVKERFSLVRSGARVRHPKFTTRHSWSCDILFTQDRGPVVVEYDVAYWHAGEAKPLVDAHKTRDRLAAARRVVR